MKNSLFLVMALAMVFFCALPAFALDDADGHQLWDDYPRSPQLTSSYPHQVITNCNCNSHPFSQLASRQSAPPPFAEVRTNLLEGRAERLIRYYKNQGTRVKAGRIKVFPNFNPKLETIIKVEVYKVSSIK